MVPAVNLWNTENQAGAANPRESSSIDVPIGYPMSLLRNFYKNIIPIFIWTGIHKLNLAHKQATNFIFQ